MLVPLSLNMSVRGLWVGVCGGFVVGEVVAVLLEPHPPRSKEPAKSVTAPILTARIAKCFRLVL